MSLVHKFAIGFLLFFGAFILYFNWVIAYNGALAENGRSLVTPFIGVIIPSSINGWAGDRFFGFGSIIYILQNWSWHADYGTIWTGTADFVSSLEEFQNLVNACNRIIELRNAGGGDFLTTLRLILSIIQACIGLFDPLTSLLLAFLQTVVTSIYMLWTVIVTVINLLGGFANESLSIYSAPVSMFTTNDPMNNVYWLPTWVNNSITYFSTTVVHYA